MYKSITRVLTLQRDSSEGIDKISVQRQSQLNRTPITDCDWFSLNKEDMSIFQDPTYKGCTYFSAQLGVIC